ncbi:Beclin-1-like protein [Camellia lanceoleosa]|uniref:Beclin-1-like protein n=1 Tax=Camellia lanceoleosa TaxID=1840588 RepID=A0ACC0J1F8_9ERIC|nr:Beclin-1-like protein [Camellia lanceoleosa]
MRRLKLNTLLCTKKIMLTCSEIRYRKYPIKEIEVATDYFSNSLKIGEGGYGPVYKAFLDHTPVAIKVLRSEMSQGNKQFQRELHKTSKHGSSYGAPYEYGCLVYEYMENGSLEDRLFRKNNSPPLPWKTRFRISAEVTAALLFLHRTKPNLKPATILLNRNYVSKISDVGLARYRTKILPMGNYPRIMDSSNNTYELFGPVNLFWSTCYDKAMTLFLTCLKEFAEFANSKDKENNIPAEKCFKLPYKIENDRVENYSITQSFNKQENWTKALKYTLCNLKWALY